MPSGAILKHIKNLQCHYFLFLNKVKLETAYKWSALLAESSKLAQLKNRNENYSC